MPPVFYSFGTMIEYVELNLSCSTLLYIIIHYSALSYAVACYTTLEYTVVDSGILYLYSSPKPARFNPKPPKPRVGVRTQGLGLRMEDCEDFRVQGFGFKV